jgi:hypothetical protein
MSSFSNFKLCKLPLFFQADKEFESLDSSLRQQLLTAIHLRQDEIHHTLVNNTTAISQAHLKDFDWKVNVSGFICQFSL